MAAGEGLTADALPSAPQGLLLTGEGVAVLTDEHRELLRQVASAMTGGLAIEASLTDTIPGQSHSRPESELEPIPVGLPDFWQFAMEQRLSTQLARNSWRLILYTREFQESEGTWGRGEPPPRLRFLDDGQENLDLRSLKVRLDYNIGWPTGTPRQIQFLRTIVAARISQEAD